MNEADRLNLRARQILDDPELSLNQRITNAGALFKQIVTNAEQDPASLDVVLSEIADPVVRDAMEQAVLSAMQPSSPTNPNALNTDVLIASLTAKVTAQAAQIAAVTDGIVAPLTATVSTLATVQVTAQELQAQSVGLQSTLGGPTPLKTP